MHVHYLHWLMPTGLLHQSAFFRPCKSTTGEMAPMDSGGLQLGSGDLISVPLLAHICLGLVVEYWPLWVYVDVTATLNLPMCHLASLFMPLPPPTPCTPPAHLFIYTGPISQSNIIINTGQTAYADEHWGQSTPKKS